MNSPTAADYGWISTSDTFSFAREVGYSLVLACGPEHAEALRALGAEPCGTAVGFGEIADAAMEDPDVAGIVSVPGGEGPWLLLLACTDGFAMRPGLLRAVSAGGRAVVHSANGGKPMDFFFWYEDGDLRTQFEYTCDRTGSDPDGLVPLMREVGCDVDDVLELDLYAEKAAVVALTERLTGVRITDDLLSGAEYRLVRIPERPGRV
ncbi:DUF6461 domain-containing protein [Yinghuangia sp. YIM S09857]|uniref:DUF6461 domain-containing protein n=1 Tax=Yinghuangia sp. YIM S09857 TaxID=3436929 RepID=UPI003F5346CB